MNTDHSWATPARNAAPVSRVYADVGEAALTLGVTVQEVHRYISLGLLDRYRVHGTPYVRVSRAQVAELASVDPELLRMA